MPGREPVVDIDPRQFEAELAAFINENCMEIAKQIARDAKATTAFKDVTGNLRKSIKAKKSKFPDGGAIVVATAPHAHLLEFGTSKMPKKAFLRPALDKNIAAARAMFGAKD